MNIEEIGRFVRYLRKNSKLTQEELIRKTNVASRQVLGRLEAGPHNIQVQNLIEFLDVFGYELTITGKGTNLDGDVNPEIVKLADQIYNTVALNFGHTRATRSKIGWVYIFKEEGKESPIKIGYTQQDTPLTRLASLNTHSPKKYELFYAKLDTDCRYTEKTLMIQLEESHINGEWYNVNCNLAKQMLTKISKHEEIKMKDRSCDKAV